MPSTITAFCRACQRPRYRSIRPLGTEDTASPELFAAVDADAPPPSKGPAKCHVCMDTLVFIADKDKLAEPNAVKLELPVNVSIDDISRMGEMYNQAAAPEVPVPMPSTSGTQNLFICAEGEEMKGFEDKNSYFIVITNKRIVRVGKG